MASMNEEVWKAGLAAVNGKHEKTRVISANDMHVIMTQCLDAAQEIHIAMCLFDDNHAAQERLNNALHAALIGAEQCRRLHKSGKVRIALDDDVASCADQ